MNITDDQRLTGATPRSGCKIPTYDDGFGSLWVFENIHGIAGIVRAQTFEDAYSIVEDEFQPEADVSVEELREEYGDQWHEHPCFQEAYGFRPNGPNHTDKHGHGIYAKDLNGEALELLTAKHNVNVTLEDEN